MFLLFEAASRLKVSFVKSVLIPVGNVEEVSLLANILGVWDCLFASKKKKKISCLIPLCLCQ